MDVKFQTLKSPFYSKTFPKHTKKGINPELYNLIFLLFENSKTHAAACIHIIQNWWWHAIHVLLEMLPANWNTTMKKSLESIKWKPRNYLLTILVILNNGQIPRNGWRLNHLALAHVQGTTKALELSNSLGPVEWSTKPACFNNKLSDKQATFAKLK